jgi:hypothetical protein
MRLNAALAGDTRMSKVALVKFLRSSAKADQKQAELSSPL